MEKSLDYSSFKTRITGIHSFLLKRAQLAVILKDLEKMVLLEAPRQARKLGSLSDC